jgi:hypothetical protein
MGKKIPGLDHHCKWLNTGIGRRNYLIFFALVSLIFVLWSGQWIVGLLVLIFSAIEENDDPSNASVRMGAGGYIAVALHQCTVAFFLFHVGQLILFHRMLQRTGQSTYGYMAAAAKKRTAARKAARLAREMSTPTESVGSDAGAAAVTVAPEVDSKRNPTVSGLLE